MDIPLGRSPPANPGGRSLPPEVARPPSPDHSASSGESWLRDDAELSREQREAYEEAQRAYEPTPRELSGRRGYGGGLGGRVLNGTAWGALGAAAAEQVEQVEQTERTTGDEDTERPVELERSPEGVLISPPLRSLLKPTDSQRNVVGILRVDNGGNAAAGAAAGWMVGGEVQRTSRSVASRGSRVSFSPAARASGPTRVAGSGGSRALRVGARLDRSKGIQPNPSWRQVSVYG